MIWIMSDNFSALEDMFTRLGAEEQQLGSGQVLFRQGDAPRGLYLLTAGSVDLVRWTRAGDKALIHAAHAGETFAEASLFVAAYHCDAVAREASVVRCCRTRPLMSALQSDGALAALLFRHLAETVRDARRLLELRRIVPLTDRLYQRLQELAGEDGALPAGMKLGHIADEIAATPEAVYRAAARLEAAGRIRRPGRGVICLVT